jgi:signal transduction histidine kinase
VLDHPGYRLIRAESAERALFALLATDFALLILDIRMPGLSGLELARLIKTRKRNAEVPIIFLTACVGDEQKIIEGYGTGAVDYLFKPINPVILRSKVTVFAELYRRNQALMAEVSRRRQAEEQLRALTHFVVQGQENERARLGNELHDNITQLLCAVLVRSQTLSSQLSTHDGPIKREALKLRNLLGQTAEAVESISRGLRPGVLDILGLVAVLRASSKEFTERTGVSVTFECMPLTERLPTKVELSLYRIVQKAFKNVEQHAHAKHLTVGLSQSVSRIQLTIKDDGVGFETKRVSGENNSSGFGLLRMRERANSVGGILEVISARNNGTEIKVSIPLTQVS